MAEAFGGGILEEIACSRMPLRVIEIGEMCRSVRGREVAFFG